METERTKSFLLYADQREIVADLSDDERGRIFSALFDYVCDGTIPSFKDKTLRIAFTVFRMRIDDDREKAAYIREKRSAAVRSHKGNQYTDLEQNGTKRNKTEQSGTNRNKMEQNGTKRNKTKQNGTNDGDGSSSVVSNTDVNQILTEFCKVIGIAHNEDDNVSLARAISVYINSEDNNINNINNNNISPICEKFPPEAVFELWWVLYDNKKGRKHAVAKWLKLKPEVWVKAIVHTAAYVRSTPDKSYRKQPETYINGECWNDEVVMHGEYKPAQTDLYPRDVNDLREGDAWFTLYSFNLWCEKRCPKLWKLHGFPRSEEQYKKMCESTVGGFRALCYVTLVLERDGWEKYEDERGFMWIYRKYIENNGLYKGEG